jgi:hypothetical protein
MDLVIEFPERWPVGEYGTRKFVLRRFPFAVVYREKPAVIQVLADAHGHRRPGYWKIGSDLWRSLTVDPGHNG